MIPWDKLDDQDIQSINKLAVRASQLALQVGGLYPVPDASMDIAACHLHAPLDLPALSAANDYDFADDVFGIHDNINRDNGALKNRFTPRFAKTHQS